MAMGLFTSCKKEQLHSGTQLNREHKIHATTGADMMAPYRSLSPYSAQVVRALRAKVAASGDDEFIAVVNKPLKLSNTKLYYKIDVTNETNAHALNTWLTDTNNLVVRYPLDSVLLFPNIFTEDKMLELEEQNTTFYTTVPIQAPLPSNINAQVLDTLYIPDEDEKVLDFLLNMVTANFSNEYIDYLSVQAPSIHAYVQNIHDNEQYLTSGSMGPGMDDNGFNNNFDPFKNSDGNTFIVPRELFSDDGTDVVSPNIFNNVEQARNVTFTDNTLNVNEGVNNLKVVASRFVLMPTVHTTRTNVNGQFASSLPRYGVGVLNLVFANDKLRIRSFDGGSNTFMSTIYNGLVSALRITTPASNSRIVNPFNNINDININFAHGSKQAFWSLSYNGIQQGNQYAVNLGMRGHINNSPFLDVLCYYKNASSNNTLASAPMLGPGHVSVFSGGTELVFRTTDLLLMAGAALPGILPDVIFTQSRNSPVNTNVLRHTIYHEYGHTLHYFSANNANNKTHWITNINHTVSATGYGTDINANNGGFFALSEGWADYIGHTFAFMRYGTGVLEREWNVWTNSTDTNHYQGLLEEVPTYFNNFIPRGLFFDLTDGFNNDESNFDNVQGFTTNDIYQLLTQDIYTIQEFRAEWLNLRTNATTRPIHEILFEEYNIN